jgi:hypothetical protein
MTNGILCAIDFSSASADALKWSINLAQRLSIPLTILYTYRLFKHNGEAVAVKKQMEADAARNFSIIENEMLKDKGIKYEFKSEIGFVDDRIADHIKNNKISFLVMDRGLNSRSKESLEDFIGNLQIPLVIVP